MSVDERETIRSSKGSGNQQRGLAVVEAVAPEADGGAALLGEGEPESRHDPGIEEASAHTAVYAGMLKEVRSWGLWSLGLGVMHLVVPGLGATWGVVLLLVGLASFIFRESSMFVVYGVTMVWVAISNALGGASGWIVFALFQLFLAVRIFGQYVRFRRAEQAMTGLDLPQRASDAFPLIGCGLGALSVFGFLGLFAGAIVAGALTGWEAPSVLYWLLELLIDLSCVGFAVALASLLSKYPRRWLAILGMISSGLAALVGVVLPLL